MRTRTQHWDKQQIRSFVKQAKLPWGYGWTNLSDEMREGALAAVAIGIITGQTAESVAVEVVQSLITEMRIVAGLSTRAGTRPEGV